MQAVAYYVELLQYDIVDMTTVEPPFTLAQDDPSASTAAPTTTGTNKMPVSTTPATTTTATTSAVTTTPSSALPARPTVAHAPGYYAPIVAVPLPLPATDTSSIAGAGTNDNKQENTGADVAAPVDVNRPQMGTLPLLSISNTQFFNWFLQGKEEGLSQQSGESGVHTCHP